MQSLDKVKSFIPPNDPLSSFLMQVETWCKSYCWSSFSAVGGRGMTGVGADCVSVASWTGREATNESGDN